MGVYTLQLASLLGCVIGLKTAASGVSIVALGTSVPDTFASRTAAKQDEYADAAIGNITGSNSVNVFLGLGMPWVLLTIWYKARFGIDYPVQSENLTQAVILFVIVGTVCLVILLIRRFVSHSFHRLLLAWCIYSSDRAPVLMQVVGGELGGKKTTAYLTGAFLVTLWISFIAIVILIVYRVIVWDLP